MISMKKEVVKALRKIENLNVVSAFPLTLTKFPTISYVEEVNLPYMKCDGKERITNLVYKLDLFTDKSPTELASQVDEVMTELGFQRKFCFEARESDKVFHKVFRYELLIDSETNIIYQI